MQPKTRKTEELEATFNELAERWERETGFISNGSMFEHPAYKQIIAMGEPAVPLILRRMEQTGCHWFVALRLITGAEPVPRELWGKIMEIEKIWLQWGREQGYRW